MKFLDAKKYIDFWGLITSFLIIKNKSKTQNRGGEIMCYCELGLSCDEREEIMKVSEILWLESLPSISEKKNPQTRFSKEESKDEY